MRKTITLFIASIVLLALAFSVSTVAWAENTEKQEVFSSGSFAYTLDKQGNATITNYFGTEKVLDIPSMMDGHTITSIGASAFSGCDSLTEITLPDSVTSIGAFAFSRCGSLTEITLPDRVIIIGDSAFSESGLTRIKLPDGLKIVGNSAFELSRLSEITLPDSVISIGDWAFAYCGLTKITVPDGVKNIGMYTFCSCGLKEMTLPDSVTSIGDSAFLWCDSMSEIVIPDSVTSIGWDAFSDCDSLTVMVSKGSYAEQYAKDNGLRYQYQDNTESGPASETEETVSATVPGKKHISGDYEYTLDKMGNVTIEKYIGKETSLNIPAEFDGHTLTGIGAGAFDSCSNLTEITLPDSLTSIGAYAFHHCYSLTEITIPDNVTRIGSNAFLYCGGVPPVAITVSEGSYAELCVRGSGLKYQYPDNTENSLAADTKEEVSEELMADIKVKEIFEEKCTQANEFDKEILLPNLEDMNDLNDIRIMFVQGKRGRARPQSIYTEPNGLNRWAVQDGSKVMVYASYLDHSFVEVMVSDTESEGTFGWIPNEYLTDVWSSAISDNRTNQY